MRILVLGGTGFIGIHVVRHLSETGHEVTVVHRGHTRAPLPAGVDVAIGERGSLADMASLITTLTPQVVIDMIPVTEADARALMTAVKCVPCRVVVVSSIDVYRAWNRLRRVELGPPDDVPLSEAAPLRERLYAYRGVTPRGEQDSDRWLDDYDKILVEPVVMGRPTTPGTILRLPMVYGPGDRQHRLFKYMKRMDDGRPAILLQESVTA